MGEKDKLRVEEDEEREFDKRKREEKKLYTK